MAGANGQESVAWVLFLAADEELVVLQINDLTGMNQQLQLELQEATNSSATLKEELLHATQRYAVKNREMERVVKVTENSTVCVIRSRDMYLQDITLISGKGDSTKGLQERLAGSFAERIWSGAE
jgi:hypothetical protein